MHEKSSNLPDEHGPKAPTFDTSHKLWNAAYDDLEKDEAELVGSYLKVLERVLCSEASKDPALDVANVAAELKDPSQRQIYMQKLVKEGKAKVARASKITKAVGDFFGAIGQTDRRLSYSGHTLSCTSCTSVGWCLRWPVSELMSLSCFVL